MVDVASTVETRNVAVEFDGVKVIIFKNNIGTDNNKSDSTLDTDTFVKSTQDDNENLTYAPVKKKLTSEEIQAFFVAHVYRYNRKKKMGLFLQDQNFLHLLLYQ